MHDLIAAVAWVLGLTLFVTALRSPGTVSTLERSFNASVYLLQRTVS